MRVLRAAPPVLAEMELSDEQIERLEILAELQRAGKITDEEFAEFRAAIIEGRTSADNTDGDDKSVPRFDLDALTSCQAGSKRARRRRLTQQKEILAKSLHARKIVEKSKNPPPPMPGPQQIKPAPNLTIGQIKAPVRPTGPSGIQKSLGSRRKRRLSFIPTILTVGVVVVITIVILTSKPVEQLILDLKSYNSNATALTAASENDKDPFVEPLFGPVAVRSCLSGCLNKSDAVQTACKRACQRLSLSEYPRRITLSDPDPALDAATIKSRCLDKTIRRTVSDSRGAWQREMKSALALLSQTSSSSGIEDFGKKRLSFNALFDISSSLRLPVQGSEEELALTGDLIRGTCLRANLTLAELALMIVKQNSDSLSRRYYSRLHKILQPATESWESNLFNQATALSLLDHEKKRQKP